MIIYRSTATINWGYEHVIVDRGSIVLVLAQAQTDGYVPVLVEGKFFHILETMLVSWRYHRLL